MARAGRTGLGAGIAPAAAGVVVRGSLELGVAERAEQVLPVLSVLAEVRDERRRAHVAELQRAEVPDVDLAPVRIEVARSRWRHCTAARRPAAVADRVALAGRLAQCYVGLEEELRVCVAIGGRELFDERARIPVREGTRRPLRPVGRAIEVEVTDRECVVLAAGRQVRRSGSARSVIARMGSAREIAERITT